MQLKIVLDGNTYISKVSLADAEELSNIHYKNADELTTFMTELENGEFMVLGPEACKKAVFLYIPSP